MTLSVQVGESLGQKFNSGSFHNQKSKKIYKYGNHVGYKDKHPDISIFIKNHLQAKLINP